MGVIVAGCDSKYLQQHGKAFIRSVAATGQQAVIVLFLEQHEQFIVPSFRIPKTISIITDRTLVKRFPNADRKTLWACGRFWYASKLFYKFKKPCITQKMLIVDIDAVVRGPVDWDDFKDVAVSLYKRQPLAVAGWEKEGTEFAAGAVMLKRGVGQTFAQNVANELETMYDCGELKWFADQVAINRAFNNTFLYKENSSHFIQMPKKYIDWEFRNESVIWTGKGARKFSNQRFVDERSYYERRDF